MKWYPILFLPICVAALPAAAGLAPGHEAGQAPASVLDLGLPAGALGTLFDDGVPDTARAGHAVESDFFPGFVGELPEDGDQPDVDGAPTWPIHARVGSQKLAYSSLIHSDLDRPGAVARLDMGPAVQVRGFGASAQEVSGFDALLGTSHADYRINGVIVEQRLDIPGADQGRLTGGWLSGVASSDDVDLRSGRAWSLAGDAAWAANRLLLRMEYAGSELDPMRANPGKGRAAGSGQAYRARLDLQSAGSAPGSWRVGSEFSSVSAQFGSLANPGLVADRELAKAFAIADLGEWDVDLQWDQRRANPRNEPGRAAIEEQHTRLALTWAAEDSGPFDLLGRPSCTLRAGVKQSRDRQTTAAAAQTMSLSLQTEFARPQWLWGVRTGARQGPGAIDAPVALGVETFAVDLYGKTLAEHAPPLSPVLSWERKRDLASGTWARRVRAGLTSSSFELRHDVRADFDVGYQHRMRSDGSIDQHAARLSAKLRWLLQRPSSAYNGLALEFAGRYIAGGDAGTAFGDDFKVMLSLSSVGLTDM
ncbi:MAG: hypothetical protein KDI82_04810 [Gammaproteobacteria bacterium]|nr:hypothetical protein [Gammaproteobacteria bacterium]